MRCYKNNELVSRCIPVIIVSPPLRGEVMFTCYNSTCQFRLNIPVEYNKYVLHSHTISCLCYLINDCELVTAISYIHR